MDRFIKILSTAICACAGFLWGKLDGLMIALIAFIVLDYISGVLVGASQHSLNSKISFIGISKKLMILILVAMCNIIDRHLIGGGASIMRSGACGLYIASEGMSIVENAGKLGLPIPQKLRKFFTQLHDKSNESEEEKK